MKIKVSFKNWVNKLLLIEDHPRSIAGGFAIGSFIGFMPIPGFQLIVSIGIASILKINRKAACLAVFNTNILTGAFIFALNFWIGKTLLGISTDFIMPEKISIHFLWQVLGAGPEVFISMVFGGILTGIITASSCYYLIQWILSKNNKKNE
jgi:uncharacterized protein (DUF2062 family)